MNFVPRPWNAFRLNSPAYRMRRDSSSPLPQASPASNSPRYCFTATSPSYHVRDPYPRISPFENAPSIVDHSPLPGPATRRTPWPCMLPSRHSPVYTKHSPNLYVPSPCRSPLEFVSPRYEAIFSGRCSSSSRHETYPGRSHLGVLARVAKNASKSVRLANYIQLC